MSASPGLLEQPSELLSGVEQMRAKVSGDDGWEQYQITRKRCDEFGFDTICNFVVGMREMHHIVCIVFDRKDADSRKRAHKLIRAPIDDAAARGWGGKLTRNGCPFRCTADSLARISNPFRRDGPDCGDV